MVQLARRLFTVDEYYRMAEAGILHEDDRVELIQGEIVEMTPIGSGHASVVDTLTELLVTRAGRDEVIVRIQGPVRLNQFSEPQPDVSLLRPRADRYRESHPGPSDVLLLIEVADTSLEYDTQVKLPLYAAAGMQEVWIVDLQAGAIHVYREPSGDAYASQRTAVREESVSPVALPGVVLAVDEILVPGGP